MHINTGVTRRAVGLKVKYATELEPSSCKAIGICVNNVVSQRMVLKVTNFQISRKLLNGVLQVWKTIFKREPNHMTAENNIRHSKIHTAYNLVVAFVFRLRAMKFCKSLSQFL